MSHGAARHPDLSAFLGLRLLLRVYPVYAELPFVGYDGHGVDEVA